MSEVEKNLSREEIEKRIEKLRDEIIYSDEPRENAAHLLYSAVKLVSVDYAVTEIKEHEAEFHKKVIGDNGDSEEK